MMSVELAIAQTKNWVSKVIVDLNLCPFAAREVINNTIRYRAFSQEQIGTLLEALKDEFFLLDESDDIETSLLIYIDELTDFEEYLDFLDLANDVLIGCGYEGVYQLASFHPSYQFESTKLNDPENYTNRSPYPTIHIIREKSLERALEGYTNPESIPERNIKLTRKLGLTHMQTLLQKCING